METFDHKGGLDDKLGRHKAKDIPADFGWDQMGPKIRAELQTKKRRRVLWWWLPVGLSVMVAVGYLAASDRKPDLGFFNIPGLSTSVNVVAFAKTTTQPDGKTGQEEASQTLVSASQTVKPSLVVRSNIIETQSELEWKSQIPPAARLKGALLDVTDQGTVAFYDTAQQVDKKLSLLDGIATLIPKQVKTQAASNEDIAIAISPSKGIPWLIEAAAGFTCNLNPDVSSSRLPNTVTDPLTGVSASLRLGYWLNQHPYTIWTGIDMEELVQRERLQDALPVQLYQPNTVDTIFQNIITGETFSTTTDSVPGIRRINIQQHSTFRSWSVPIMIGRAWSLKGWQLEGRAGVDLNLSSWQSGGYLTEGYELVNAGTQYRAGWAMRLEGQLLLPPARFGQLFVRGGYRRFMNKTEGMVDGDSFRPQSLNVVMGWRVNW
jgi:hypothetical protein